MALKDSPVDQERSSKLTLIKEMVKRDVRHIKSVYPYSIVTYAVNEIMLINDAKTQK